MWDKLIGDATDAMPDFNDYLLIGFRKQKVHELVERIDNVFRETVKVFDNKLKYLGYRFLTPEERIDHCLNNAILRGSIEIQQSNFMLVQFEFEFEGVSHCTQINVPYMENFSLKLSDTEYYPLFPIVERGGLHHTKNDIIVKVMRAPLSFKRTEEYVIKTLSGITIQERVITAKIHQRSRRGKRLARTPAMLYHLAKYGLLGTFSYYNMDPNEIQIVQTDLINYEDGVEYIPINELKHIYMKIPTTALQDLHKRRVIASLLVIFEDNPNFKIVDLYNPKPVYFQVALGRYTYPSNTKEQLILNNAQVHLKMTDTLLDAPERQQLAEIGIHVTDIYDLIRVIFFNMDRWIIQYNPTDLYSKKIGSLDQITSSLVTDFFSKQFQILNDKEGLTQDTVASFMRSIGKLNGWFSGSTVFRANPSLCNDNYLTAIGAKQFLSIENIETKSTKGGPGKSHGGKRGKKMPVSLMVADPSRIGITSILAYPSSQPIVSGDMNPFAEITQDGNFIKPDFADEIEHVFD